MKIILISALLLLACTAIEAREAPSKAHGDRVVPLPEIEIAFFKNQNSSVNGTIDRYWELYKYFGVHLHFDENTDTGYVSGTVFGKDEGGKFQLEHGGVKIEFNLEILDESIEITRVDKQFHIHVIYKVGSKTVIDKTWIE